MSTVVVALLTACGDPPPAPPRPEPPRPATYEGCDRERLQEVLEGLGAGRVRHGRFRGEVPVGEPTTTALRRCELGERLETCEARYGSGEGHVRVDARTEVRFSFERQEARTELGRRLEALSEDDPTLELGRRTRRRVLTDARVCVRRWATTRVRVPEATAPDLTVAHQLGHAGDDLDLVWDAAPRGGLRVRCRARDEIRPGPLEGPCAVIAAGADAPGCESGVAPSVRLVGGRVYGVSPDGVLGGRVGLENGDQLRAACGRPVVDLTGLDAIVRAGRCPLRVSRDGAEVRISLDEACGARAEPPHESSP